MTLNFFSPTKQLNLLIGLFLFFVLPNTGFAAYPPVPTPLTGITNNIKVVTDELNHALALYDNAEIGQIESYYFANNVWTNIPFPVTSAFSPFDVSMEPSGTALVQVLDSVSSDLLTFYFDGLAWSTPTPNPLDVSVIVGGEVDLINSTSGLTAWRDSSSNIVASFF